MLNEHKQYAYTGMPPDVFRKSDRILCPRCETVLEVFHFDWTACTCLNCHQDIRIEEFLVLNNDDKTEQQLV